MVASHKRRSLTVEKEVLCLIIPQHTFGTCPAYTLGGFTLCVDDEPQGIVLVDDVVREALQSTNTHLRQVYGWSASSGLIGEQRIASCRQLFLVGHNGKDDLALLRKCQSTLDGDHICQTFADMDVRLDEKATVDVEVLQQTDGADAVLSLSWHEASTLIVECTFDDETSLDHCISTEGTTGTQMHIALDVGGFQRTFRDIGAACLI